MLRPLLLFILLITATASFAQDTSFLHTFNTERIHTTRSSMMVLGGWGTLNLATGLIAMSTTDGQTKYFHQMNAIWGAVNVGIAAASYLGYRRLDPGQYNWQGSVKEQNKIQTIYLVNGALDVAYIGAGVAMREYGNTKVFGTGYERWRGYGTSFIVQGAFLLLYDGVNFAIHQSHGKQLYHRFNDLQLAVAPGHVSLIYAIN